MLKMDGFAGVIMAFNRVAVFMTITALVILLMDVLECFLHALCLLWVEFQTSFYKADGFKFAPFFFKAFHVLGLREVLLCGINTNERGGAESWRERGRVL